MKRAVLVGLSLFVVCGVLLAGQAGSVKQVGKAGDWANTIAAAAVGDIIYSVEASGALYATDPATGAWKKVGTSAFANTQFLFAAAGSLYSIEKSGNLYVISPSDGSWKPVGAPGAWANTIAGVALGNKIYTVEASGTLYVTEPSTGVWTKLGASTFGNTQHLFAVSGKLYSVEKSGNLFTISPADGSYAPVGKPGGWSGTIAGVGAGGRLMTVESAGALYETDAATGAWKGLGGPVFGGTQFMLACRGALFTIDKGGSLHQVELGAAGAAAPAPPPAAAKPSAAPATGGAAVAGNLTFAFMGKWKGDTTTYEQDPAFKQQAAGKPELAKMLIGMLQGMTMDVTLDGITMTIMGEKVGPVKFSVISATGNVLTIESVEEGKPPTRQDIVFLDAKRIKMAEKGNEAKALFLVKQ